MNSSKLKSFDPEFDHIARPEYGVMAIPTTKAVKITKFGNKKLAIIPKKHLGVGVYQRPIDRNQDKARIMHMRNNWKPDQQSAKVVEIKHGRKYYYQLADGQHNTCANPYEKIECEMVTDKAAVDVFREANDKETNKAINTDHDYWAQIYTYNVVSSADTTQAMFVHKLFRKHGFHPEPRTRKTSQSDFGQHVSKLHMFYQKNILGLMKKYQRVTGHDLYGLSDAKITNKAKQVFTDVMDIMFGVFGKESFTSSKSYYNAWSGLMDFLYKINWQYDKEYMIQTLRIGEWAMNGRGKARTSTLQGIEDWKRAAIVDYSGLNRKANQWRQLFSDVYAVSSRR